MQTQMPCVFSQNSGWRMSLRIRFTPSPVAKPNDSCWLARYALLPTSYSSMKRAHSLTRLRLPPGTAPLGGIADGGSIVMIATHDSGTRASCTHTIDLTDYPPSRKEQ